ncbi:hypothetical protein G4B88_006857 [Cannabis sativa]|uniref:Uncharacterized protein n=1 Tax=Cannabis sativa TaxID=3483 RepID=A0A7J6G3Z8_CANSA|nr:hypothetical protein G4B88_006857 [Cannabis sativa]
MVSDSARDELFNGKLITYSFVRVSRYLLHQIFSKRDSERTKFIIGRALHIASKGTALGIVTPLPSLISSSSSLILSQSKHWIKHPKVKPTKRWARPDPGQALLPSPNGINLLTSLPLSSLSSSNLVGNWAFAGAFLSGISLRRSLLTSSLLIPEKDFRRVEEKISMAPMRRRLRQWSPYGDWAKCFPRRRGGRLAKTMSFLVKHSSTADGDDTMTTWRDPNHREKTSPYLKESNDGIIELET